MRWNLEKWIEDVKAKPEPVRYRYVIGCVATSMFFILIIWSLTVSEGFKKDGKVEQPGISGILPKASDFSLDAVLSGDKALDENQPKSSEEFMREQMENRDRPNFEENGVTPKDDSTDASAGAIDPTLTPTTP